MSTETITQEELAGALKRLGYSDAVRANSSDEADAIVADIQAHREPEYEPDEVYVSALNVKYYRRAQYEDGRVWLDIQSGEEVRHGVPARPLRKLVPEDPEREVKIANVNFTDGYRAGQRDALKEVSQTAATAGNADADQAWKDGYEKGAAGRKPSRNEVINAIAATGDHSEVTPAELADRIMKLLEGDR